MVGPAIGGLVGQFSLSAPLFLAAAVTLLNMCWGFFALKESLPKEKRSHSFEWSHLNPFRPFAHVFSSRSLITLFASSFLFFFAGTMLQGNLSVFLRDIMGFGPGGIGFVLFVVGIMDILSQGFLTSKLMPIFGERKLAVVGLIGSIAFAPSVMLLYVAVIVFNLGDGLFQPSANGLIANAAPQGQQGSIQGAYQGQQSIARMLGPLAAAFLYTLGASVPYMAGGIVILVALGILLMIRSSANSTQASTTR